MLWGERERTGGSITGDRKPLELELEMKSDKPPVSLSEGEPFAFVHPDLSRFLTEHMDRLTGNQFKVAYALCSRMRMMGKYFTCWPSLNTIMSDTGINQKKTVIAAIKRLIELGYLEKDSCHGGNPKSPHTHNIYYWLLPEREVSKSTL